MMTQMNNVSIVQPPNEKNVKQKQTDDGIFLQPCPSLWLTVISCILSDSIIISLY